MAFSTLRAFSRSATQFISQTSRIEIASRGLRSSLNSRFFNAGIGGVRSWSVWSRPASLPSTSSTSLGNRRPNPCTCGACGIHTEGDKTFANYLQEEISQEQKIHKDVSTVQGFEVSREGAIVTLTKTTQDEKLTVELTLNESVTVDSFSEIDEEAAAQEEDQDMPQENIGAFPKFTVHLQKSGQPILSFFCAYIEDAGGDYAEEDGFQQESESEESQNLDDLFEIGQITIHDGEISDNTYRVSSSVLDGEMYDKLMSMLEERGVDNIFAEKLSEFTFSQEHKLYLDFLDKLQTIVKT